ncbi:MAG: phosphoenolpyruvate--protein phosphotransferase [Alphaproteobacteria bacterium]
MKTERKAKRPRGATAKSKTAHAKPGRKDGRKDTQRVFEGLGVSPGVGIGKVHLRESGEVQVLEYQVPARRVPEEIKRFHGALAQSRRQVGKLAAKAERYHGAAAEELGYLLEAHLQMLKSASLIGGIERRIEASRCNAEFAVMAEIGAIAENFAAMDDAYLRARGQEVREVGLRVVRNLTKTGYASFSQLEPDSVIIAEDVTPADTALMDPQQIRGFASVLGGAEGHTAIMARSLGLPAVLGVTGLIGGVQSGDTVVIDGSGGRVIINPTARCLADYRRRRQQLARQARSLARLRKVPAVTRDGTEINLQANLELPRELAQALTAGAEGIGLLRTEFLYMNRDDLPDEEEQYAALRGLVLGMAGRPVTVRTLDVGGEKLASSLGPAAAEGLNPALGLRAIRLSLKRPKLLETQLAAALRAAAHGPLRILLPMISTISEVVEVRKVLLKVARRLHRRGIEIGDPLPPLGVMIEVPGAALSADSLATVSDFFAIGSNDLTMYTLAIDRGEEQVAHLYNPLHPAVLRLVQFSIEAALVKSRILHLDMQAATQRARIIMDQSDSGRITALIDDFNEAL